MLSLNPKNILPSSIAIFSQGLASLPILRISLSFAREISRTRRLRRLELLASILMTACPSAYPCLPKLDTEYITSCPQLLLSAIFRSLLALLADQLYCPCRAISLYSTRWDTPFIVSLAVLQCRGSQEPAAPLTLPSCLLS